MVRKLVVILILVSSLFILGCDSNGGTSAIYGTWLMTVDIGGGDTETATLTLNENGTFTMVFATNGITDAEDSGTFTFTETTVTITSDGDPLNPWTAPYTLDGDTLIIYNTGMGDMLFIRQ